MFQTILQTVKMHDFRKVAFYDRKIASILVIAVPTIRILCAIFALLCLLSRVSGVRIPDGSPRKPEIFNCEISGFSFTFTHF